jgi:prepilin signal peptidase PulO-like enzyme (type II secretory pathway)
MNVSEEILYLILFLLTFYASFTDWKHRLIYDRVILIGLVSAMICRSLDSSATWWDYIGTGLVTLIVLSTVAVATGGRAIGGGDIKILSMLGFSLGILPFLTLFLVSHLTAIFFLLIWKVFHSKKVNKDTTLPFAPFILLGLIVTKIVVSIGLVSSQM